MGGRPRIRLWPRSYGPPTLVLECACGQLTIDTGGAFYDCVQCPGCGRYWHLAELREGEPA